MKSADIQEQMLHNTLQQTHKYIACPEDVTFRTLWDTASGSC